MMRPRECDALISIKGSGLSPPDVPRRGAPHVERDSSRISVSLLFVKTWFAL